MKTFNEFLEEGLKSKYSVGDKIEFRSEEYRIEKIKNTKANGLFYTMIPVKKSINKRVGMKARDVDKESKLVKE